MSISSIRPETLKQWLDTHQAVLVDVREPAEYASEHIEGSMLMPLGKLQSELLPVITGQKLVVHCRKGGRGQTACEKLVQQMPDIDIYNLAGGIEAWAAAGLPVQKSERPILPLDRQVQLTIGVILITACALGALVNPKFFILTGLVGGGLTFAGLTGFCGLARLIAKMPWNQKT